MTMTYEQTAEAIATAIWETSTQNGRKIDRDDWDEHMTDCHAAVANSYVEGIGVDEWKAAALARVDAETQRASDEAAQQVFAEEMAERRYFGGHG